MTAMPAVAQRTPVPSTAAEVIRRGLRIGAVAGMWVAGAVAIVPCLVLLFWFGLGLPLAAIAVSVGALVGAIEGLIEAICLYYCRRWIGRDTGRTGVIGALAVAITPVGVAVVGLALQLPTVPVLGWAGGFTALAGLVGAIVAENILGAEPERRCQQRPA